MEHLAVGSYGAVYAVGSYGTPGTNEFLQALVEDNALLR